MVCPQRAAHVSKVALTCVYLDLGIFRTVKLTLGDPVKTSSLKRFIFINFCQHTCTYDLDTLSFFPPSRFSWSRLHMSVEGPTLNKYETNKQTNKGPECCETK